MENQVQALLSDCALAVLVSIGFHFTYFSPLPSSSPALWAPNLPCPGTEGLGALHLGAPPNHYMDQPRPHWARHPQRAVISLPGRALRGLQTQFLAGLLVFTGLCSG